MARQKMKTQVIISILLAFILVSAAKFPAPQGYLNDFADVLDPAAEARISQLLSQIEKEQTVEIAVVTLQSLQGDSVDQAAVDLFKEWGIGKKNDNGLLLLIAVEDRAYRFEVGYGLEGILNDAKVGRIGRESMVPYLKDNNYAEGIFQSLTAIQGALTGQNEVIYNSEIELPSSPIMGLAVSYALILLGLNIYFAKKKKHKAQNLLGGMHVVIIIIAAIISIFLMFFMFVVMIALIISSVLMSKGNLRMGNQPGYYGGFGGFGRGSGGFGGFGGGSSGGGGAGGRF